MAEYNPYVRRFPEAQTKKDLEKFMKKQKIKYSIDDDGETVTVTLLEPYSHHSEPMSMNDVSHEIGKNFANTVDHKSLKIKFNK